MSDLALYLEGLAAAIVFGMFLGFSLWEFLDQRHRAARSGEGKRDAG